MEIDLKENLYRMRENYSKKPIRFKILYHSILRSEQ